MGLRDHESLGVRARYRELERFKRERVVPSWQRAGAKRSTRVISFLEELTITSGELAGKNFEVRGFQREFIKAVYREDKRGVRPVRTAVLSMGRKNGKTQLAAALALCALCGPEAESRGEVYSCANDRFQASKIFHEMVALIKGNRYLSTRCNVLRHSKMIEDLENGSIYAALSRDAKTKMGLNPSFVVYDELGSSPDRELYDAMDSAMGARKNPLMLVISTQAADDLAPMSRLIDYGLRVNSGEVEDKSFYLKFHHAPMDADPWSKAAWEAANPALGYFRSLDDIERQAQQAQRMPDLENSFRNLILNQRVAAETRFINPAAWKACAGEPVIPPGAKVFAGLDLGSTRDLSALVIVYENPLDGAFHVKPYFWLPGDIFTRRDEDRVPYDVWVKEGFLYPAGEATDPEAIALKIAELNAINPIQGIAFDRWKIADLRRQMDKLGISVPLTEHGQGYKDMSGAVNMLENAVVTKKLRHGGNPPLTWMAQNAVVTFDPAKNRKLDKSKSIARIDGVVALAMGLAIASRQQAFDPAAMIG
jgi:phage terminase large subunit-like protein